jgi:hypothetical protein
MVIILHQAVSKVGIEYRMAAVVFAHEWDSCLNELYFNPGNEKKTQCTHADCAVRTAEKCFDNLKLPPSETLKTLLKIIEPGKNYFVESWIYYITQDSFTNRIETVSKDWKLYTAIFYRDNRPLCMLPTATFHYPMNYKDVITDMELINNALNRLLFSLLAGEL